MKNHVPTPQILADLEKIYTGILEKEKRFVALKASELLGQAYEPFWSSS